jgi:TolB-like protein/DNA-binding winged helix-turn-helix (wHTH) protein/Flp pilus assembly protein TadD
MDASEKSVYEFGEFRLDPVNQLLLCKGAPVSMTPKVFNTLVLLVERHGQLIEKDEFIRQLWPGTFVEESALAENISRLRRALGETAGALIVTVPKRGYRFVGDVRTIAPTEPKTGHNDTHTWRVPRLKVAAMGVAILTVCGLGYLYTVSRSRVAGASPNEPIRSLAVLPLENLSGDPAEDYFADGITDELITQLGRISALRVISRTSSMLFKRTSKTLAEIARELNVEAVVEGTVVRSGGRVRVTAQVIQVNPEKHLMAERYDRPLGDVVVVQGQLAREISEAIRITLTPQEQTRLASVRPIDSDAHEAYLMGRYYWGRRTEATTLKAMASFQQAIERDSQFAAAYAGLADSYFSLSLPEALQEFLAPTDAYPKARAAADRALQIDSTLAEPHGTLGMVKFNYDRDWKGAEQEFKRAIDLNANYANAHHWYGMSLIWQDRFDEALEQVERARKLDPLSLVINANLGFVLSVARRYDEGVKQVRKTLEMDANFAHAHFRLGEIDVMRGRYAEAIPELQKAISLSDGSPRATAELGLAYALQGNREAALKLLDALRHRSTERYVSPFNIALIYGGLNEKDRTLEWLEKAFAERSPTLSLLRVTPAFASVRAEPRFTLLVNRVGLPQLPRFDAK